MPRPTPLPSGVDSPGETTRAPAWRLGPAIPGYEILGELGQGGMGVVYLARQSELNRLVVLKMILAGSQAGPTQLVRFRAEAEVIARFQHPNFVQIHTIGEVEGQPYFTMEYLEGGSLDRKLLGTPLPARAAAGLLETLARAMEVAHRAGIIHRDLKPGNILLTADGTPKIADFGLAKRLGGDGSAEVTQQRLTGSDAVVGTPSYMAPEQARGGSRHISAACDLYALGAILYHALTGRPPFVGESWLDTLHQLCFEDPVPPRQLQPKVPPDLETICLKCLQKDPRRRYPNALELADDLRRYLEGQPVKARPTPWWERAGKMMRRRPLAASLAAVSVLAVGALLLLGTWHVFKLRQLNAELQGALHTARAERETAQAERETAQKEWARAERNAADAKKALAVADQTITDYFTTTSESQLLREPGMKRLRSDLLRKPLPHYQELVKLRATDPGLRAKQGRAYSHMARITNEIGSGAEAIEHYQSARRIFAQLLREHPQQAEYRSELAACDSNLGALYYAARRTAEAEKACQDALAIQAKLVGNAAAGAPQRALAHTYNTLGLLYLDTGRPAQAEAAHREALALRRQLADLHPGNAGDVAALAETHNNLGLLYRATGRPADAVASFRQSRGLFARLVRDNPEVPEYRGALAASHTNLGLLHRDAGRRGEARTAFQEALTLFTQLYDLHPNVPAYANNRARAYQNLGDLYRATGSPSEALKAYQQAVAIRERLADSHPEVPVYRSELAGTYNNLGVLYCAAKRLPEAERTWEKALAIQKPLAEKYPTVVGYQSDLAATWNNLGLLYGSSRRPDKADEAFQQALALQRPLARAHPKLLESTVALGGTYLNLGHLARDQGEPEKALGWYDEAVRTLGPLRPQERGHAGAVRFLREAYAGRAQAQALLGQHARALGDWDQALALAGGPDPVRQLARAATRARLGDHVRASEEADSVARAAPTAGEVNRLAAGVYALAAGAARGDTRLSRAAREKHFERYAARAVELLARAEAAGFFRNQTNLAHLKQDKDFAALRSWGGFQRLLLALNRKARPAGK